MGGGRPTVVRESLARRQTGEEDFRWRGEDITRLEGFTDSVFAFAVTLLVVSLEVPDTFDELLTTMRGFVAFAICFYLLLIVWYDHYRYFRRYGLNDTPTLWLNSALLFIMLMYVYPLKFLFTLLMSELFGFADTETIKTSQIPLLMIIYGAGFVAVQAIFVIMYLRAYRLRADLELDALELSVTREEIQGFLINAAVGLLSMCFAVLVSPFMIALSGYTYLLLFPLQTINGRVMGARRKRTKNARTTAESDDDGSQDPGRRRV
jgi:uncharacterized membrane protein